VVYFSQVSTPKPCTCLSCHPYVLHTPPISFFLFDHPNNIWWVIEIIKILFIKSSPIPCYLVPVRPKYLPQHPIFQRPQPVFLPQNSCNLLHTTLNKPGHARHYCSQFWKHSCVRTPFIGPPFRYRTAIELNEPQPWCSLLFDTKYRL